MKYSIIKQDARLLTKPSVIDSTFPEILEYAGRVCTATEDKTGKDSYAFLKKLLNSKHMSVFEHCSVTVELTTSRAITHQIVRHRIAAYSQQSMRYVKFTTGDKLQIIEPHGYLSWSEDVKFVWRCDIEHSAKSYESLIKEGLPAEQARGVLPQDTATKLIATWNLRELLHILYDPTCGRMMNKHAQAQVRELMVKLYADMERSDFLRWLFETYERHTEKVH